MDNIKIGRRIKQARDLRGVTLDDIAIKVGVAKSTIQRYENGKIERLKIPILHSIANSLNINPLWLVGKSDDMNPLKINLLKIVEYYDLLNDLGKLEAEKRVEELTHIERYTATDEKKEKSHLILNAAHERTDREYTAEERQHDEDIMDDEDF